MAISKIISSSISDNTVVAADVGPNAITASELADDAVDTAAIANDAVVNAKIASGVSATKLTTGTLGNTVQDNITRLGTVTTGTLSHGTTLQGYVDSSNTGVTFPAGHVVQTVVAKKSDENSASQSATTMTKVVDTSGNAEWRCQIDNVTSGNDIIVSASFSIRHQHTEDRRGLAYGFIRDTSVSNSGGTDVYEFSNGHAIYMDARSMYGGTTGTMVLYDYLNLKYVDENPGSGTFVYYVGMEVQNGSSSSILRSQVSSGNFPFVMTLQEIKR